MIEVAFSRSKVTWVKITLVKVSRTGDTGRRRYLRMEVCIPAPLIVLSIRGITSYFRTCRGQMEERGDRTKILMDSQDSQVC
jgi:hypothetical protein